jgi:DNA-binding CsgD family transcriptional regulator/tetratricopeptide (TPR) repeat protein
LVLTGAYLCSEVARQVGRVVNGWRVDDGGLELLERSEHLDTLSGFLARAVDTGRGRVVALSGDAGVGKTALVRKFAAGSGSPVWWGGCEPLFTPHPLHPFTDIAEAAGGELREILAGGTTPHEIAVAVARLLVVPSVVVLEDMHWADEASLDVLRLLARRVETLPSLVLVTYRDVGLDRWHPLRVVLGEMTAASGVSRVPLAPLSRAAVARLAGRDGDAVDDLYAITGGNPFFVNEVLADGEGDVPPTVRDAVLSRAARLSGGARGLLDAVAVVRGPCELWLLDALVGSSAVHLDEAVGSGIVTVSAGGVEFRHELARLTVEEAVPPGRSRELHQAALEALERRDTPPDAARAVHHAEGAGDAESVLRLAPLAAKDASRRGAHREAAVHYGRAVGCADDTQVDLRAGLLMRRARQCWLTVQFEEAANAQREAMRCYETLGDRGRQGAALTFLAELLWQTGSLPEALATIDSALDLLEDLPGRDLAMAYIQKAQLLLAAEDPATAMTLARRGQEIADTVDDRAIRLTARQTIAWVEMFCGEPAGIETLIAVLDKAAEAGLDAYVAATYVIIVRTACRQRRYDLAEPYLQAGIEFCTTRDYDIWRNYLFGWQAKTALARGRWNEAADMAALCLPAPCPFGRIHALVALGQLRARRGDPDPWEPLDEALAHAEPRHELQWLVPVAAARAEAAWLEGRDDDAVRETDTAWEMSRRLDTTWSAGLAYWRWRAGGGTPEPCRGDQPYLLEMSGDWQTARDTWTAMGCPYEAALAALDAPIPTLQEALVELQALGAKPAARIVANRLRSRGQRRLPRGPRASTRSNPANLTPRELDVLRHLTDGLRNAEIARRLFITEKTVDHHVAAILTKLDATTRIQAVAKAARLGITSSDHRGR